MSCLFAPLSAADVGPDGSLNWSLPIEAPVGILRPQLQISYSSGGGNGPLGLGFQIGSIPAITRMNAGTGIQYQGNDTYAGSGGRLVDVSGNKSEYHYASENFSRLVPSGTCGDGPCAFTETTATGQKIFYGSQNPDSGTCSAENACIAVPAEASHRPAGVSPESARVWAAYRIEDAFGNAMDLTYEDDGGQFYLKEIEYRDHGISTFSRIEFSYDSSRSDVFYSPGQSVVVRNAWRLTQIRTLADCGTFGCLFGDVFRTYNMNFQDGQPSRLSSLEVLAENNAHLNTTTFTWSPVVDPGYTSYHNSAEVGYDYFVPADCSGDGAADLILMTNTGILCKVFYGGGFGNTAYVSLGVGYANFVQDTNGDGVADISRYAENGHMYTVSSIFNNFYADYAPVEVGYSNSLTTFADCDGDGRNELVLGASNGNLLCKRHSTNLFHLGMPMNSRPAVGDVNGDGRSDFVTYGYNGNDRIYLALSTGTSDYTLYTPRLSTELKVEMDSAGGMGSFFDTNSPRLADCNGDGFDDLILKGNTGVHLCKLSDGQTFGEERLLRGLTATTLITADFNGDNRADLAGYDGYNPWVAVSTESGFQLVSSVSLDGYVASMFSAGDCNGDGSIDLLFTDYNRAVACMQGPGFQLGTLIGPALPTGYQFQWADINADGRSDIVGYAGNGNVYGAVSDSTRVRPNLIISIANSTGPRTDIIYDTAKNLTTVSEKLMDRATSSCGGGSGSGYGQPCGVANTSPRWLVKELKLSADGQSFSSFYQYHNGRVFPGKWNERMNLGFERLTVIDHAGGSVVREFYQTKPGAGAVRRESVYASNGMLLKRSESEPPSLYSCLNNVCEPEADVNTLKPRLMIPGKKTETSYSVPRYENGSLGSPFASVTLISALESIDQYGRALRNREEVRKGDSAGILLRTTYRATSYAVSDDGNLGLVCEKKVYVNSTAHSAVPNNKLISWEKFTYDGSADCSLPAGGKPLLTRSQTFIPGEGGGGQWIAVSKSYDERGVMQSETDATGAVTAFAFTSHGFIALETVSAGGQSYTRSFRDYHVATGQPRTTVAANGLISQITLDDFARPIVSVVGEKESRIDYAFTAADFSDNFEERCVKDSTTGQQLCTRTVVDGWGRKVKEVSASVNGETQTFKTIRYEYDGQGRMVKAFLPYYSDAQGNPTTAASTDYAETFYDSIGRAWKSVAPDGRVSVVSVDTQLGSGFFSEAISESTTVNAAGQRKRSWQGIDGPLQVTEAVGTNEEVSLYYYYDEFSQLVRVRAPQGNSEINYHPNGLQKNIIDPVAGTTSYEYYLTPGAGNFGQLKKETRAHPNQATGTIETSMEYDAWGRVTKQQHSTGDFSTFAYEETEYQNSQGKLTTAVHHTGGTTYTQHHSYDIYGNELTTSTDIAHATKTLCASAEVLPCHSVVSNAFDRLGRKSAITYPDGTTTNINYIGLTATVSSIEHAGTTYSSYSNYNINAQIGQIQFGNGVKTDYAYHGKNGLMTGLVTADATNQKLLDYAYTFDDAGNISRIEDKLVAALTHDYTYDGLNRIKTDTWNGSTQTYQFNEMGNLTRKRGRVLQYYLNTTKLQRDNVGGSNRVYDYSAAGNRVSRNDDRGILTTYEYNAQNMMSKVEHHGGELDGAVTEHFYVGEQRFLTSLKITGQPEVRTWYQGAFEIKEKWNGETFLGLQTTKTILGLDGSRIATITSGIQDQIVASQSVQHFTIASMLTFGGAPAQKISHWVRGWFYERLENPKPLKWLLFIVTIGILLVLYLKFIVIPGEKTEWVLRHKILAHGFALALVPFIANCNGSDPSLINSSYTLNFNSVYDGLPAGTHFYANNHLGSGLLITDENGEEVMRTHYDPYGSIEQNFSGKLNRDTMTFETDTAGAEYGILGIKYTGHSYDPAEDLYYMNARYMDPATGSFTTPDDYVDGEKSVMGYNRYAYVHGRPIVVVDPTGHFSLSIDKDGLQVGINFGLFGGGIKINWSNGGSLGLYAEAGPHVGVKIFGSGAMINFSTSAGVDIGLNDGRSTYNTGLNLYVTVPYGTVGVGATAYWHEIYGYRGFTLGASYELGLRVSVNANFDEYGDYTGYQVGLSVSEYESTGRYRPGNGVGIAYGTNGFNVSVTAEFYPEMFKYNTELLAQVTPVHSENWVPPEPVVQEEMPTWVKGTAIAIGTAAVVAGAIYMFRTGRYSVPPYMYNFTGWYRDRMIAARAAATGANFFSRAANFSSKSLAHTFMRHGSDWGVKGNWNTANSMKLFDKIIQHTRGARMIQGTYRGSPATHFYHPGTRLNAIYNSNGNFIGGWKLSPAQSKHLLNHGGLN